jgi:hypothetical protein
VKLYAGRAEGGLVWVRLCNCDNPTLISRVEAMWPALIDRLRLGDGFTQLR